MIVNLLGTGGSEGIPNYLCRCPACQEARRLAFARRKPTSVLVVSEEGTTILVDVGFDVTPYVEEKIDAILLTHWHHDHIAGLFKLRWTSERIELHAPSGSANREIVESPKNLRVVLHETPPSLKIGDVRIRAFPLNHSVQTFGYLIEDGSGTLAVVFDTKGLPPKSLELLKNKSPHVALIDATFSPGVHDENHNNIDEAIALGERFAELTVLAHIAHHNLPFTEAVKYVRDRSEGAVLSYDGMVIVI
ncbi:MBL fold metallo-hydrolase [Thermococcus aciditolerans]|uniref:MBL fold metallo-hydrolase n=1 Tax=Thermococcus aciditolerans TaxID=2598455 RepID=A0A5C0SRN1_9EURY|nr:MBL fold metallo-hydrolase [Thermococcus aciditolerans]QEK15559.1 MBL fold metallo-hydrolase [Thermococcus aciditolerans]